MNKEMNLKEIVEYINKELSTGRSMKDIEMNDFGVNERVLVKRLERRNVRRIGNQFVLQDSSDSPLADRVGSIAPMKSNTKSKEIIIREPLSLKDDNEFVLLKNKVDMLEKVIKELISRNSNTEEESHGFIVYSSDDKPIAKTVRLYKEIWDNLDKVKEIYSHLSAQTIINSLLKEATDKYLK